jgi:hypothetical protein
LKKVEKIFQEEYLLCILLRGADSLRYQKPKKNLAHDMIKGTDNYPKTIVETMRILNNYKDKVLPRLQQVWESNGDGIAFVQRSSGGHRGSHSKGGNITCWHCVRQGISRTSTLTSKLKVLTRASIV